ncbi:glycosyltransferase family 2 protein [Spirosoma montaniterrae]|uniref:Glycosyl transferase family 2 n=1 Tax=Spirosoma montaniterrae TaxID=1178516 RepID=A0A1P9WY24_9BACT|nr:glycosyltransferase [Spirosoma montaniterrae]AQG80264.1 glycosyl transferase family 2 [Spirosoma montaniterrae]
MIPEFSVVIPTYQRPALLLKCLDALGRQLLARDQFEIIVVDDAHSPETETAVQLFARQIARSGSPLEVRYLGQPTRRGPAAARNRGWRAARGRVVAFTDDDCLPQPNWLPSALVCFQRGAQVVTGQLRFNNPSDTPIHDRTLALLETAEFVTANCFCRKSVLERVGGFEEAFDVAWDDDNDFRFKLIQAGIPVGKCPEAVVLHPIPESPWYAPIYAERRNSYDALLYKRHPDLFRERMPNYRGLVLQYYVCVLSVLMALIGLLAGSVPAITLGVGTWATLSADLILRFLPDGRLDWRTIKHAILTGLATPFVSVYWRLYGAVKYKVLYW